MNWKEYKAQRRGNTQNIQVTSTNSSSTSSWEEYKRKTREQEEKRRQQGLKESQVEAKTQEETKIPKTTINNSSSKSKEELLKELQKNVSKSPTEQTQKREEYNNRSSTEKLKEYIETAPEITDEHLNNLKEGNLIEYKEPSNDAVAVTRNILLGAKKGLMNFTESAVSAVDNKWYQTQGSEEIYKGILGDSYDKDLFGRDKEEQQKKWDNKKKAIDTKMALNIESADTAAGKKLAELAPSIGQQLPGYMLPGGTGFVYFTGSAKGSYMEDAKARGMSEEDANAYSGIMALAEGLTDQLGAGITKKVGKSIAKKSSKEALKYFGLDIAENFIEEAVMEPISETTATLTGGKETANWDNMGKRMLNSGIDGALSSIIMAGTSAGVGKAVQVTNKINNKEEVSTQEISEAIKETLESNKVDQDELKSTIKENTNQIIKQEVENNTNSLYNNNESEADVNAEQSIDQRGILQNNETMRKQEQGRDTTNIENSQRQDTSAGISENNVSEKTIEQEYTDIETIRKTIEYAKQNQVKAPTNEIIDVQNKAKDLGINLVVYNGEEGNTHLGLTDGLDVYLDINKNNISQEDGSLMDRFSHEILHYIKRNTSFNDTIYELQNNIVDNNEEVINNFVKSKGYKAESIAANFKSALAEEVLGDYTAKHMSGYDVDYSLPEDMIYTLNTTVNDAITELKLKNNQRGQSQNGETDLRPVQQNVEQTKKIIAPLPNNKNIDTSKGELKKKYTRKEVRNRLFKEMQISPEELSVGNDIKSTNYQITDPVRVNEKVFGKELGDKINNATINKTKHNTAEKIRWQNKERQEINDLGIKARSKESAAVQKYGEKQWVNENGQTLKYGDTELAKEFPDIQTQNKIKKAAQAIRNKYDSYIDQINEILTELGYDAIPKRTDYMRHFHELGDIFSQTGVPFNLNDMSAEDLPTDINGLTEFNKPGKNWFANSQKRYGNKTTYDAITGIDGYLEGAGNLIFHTEDIQNYRALSEAIRNQFGQTKGFENLEGLTDAEKQQRIKDIQDNKLSKYVAWLDEQANSLAGKKGAIDRGFERALGRKGYTLLNTLKKQVGSNMTGFNIRSSLTNFISSTIAAAKTNKIALAKGTVSTINNMFHNDGFIEKSDFLTSRFGSDSLSAKTWQKISNAGQIFMTGSDYFTSNLIARSKYFEGLQKGMSEEEALNYSNDFSAKVMGDRSQGATAEAFNSKTLGLFTQFQLEVNNQWQYMIHDTKMDYQQNVNNKGGFKAGATALFQMGQLAAYSYFFNELFESLTGSRAAFDPIEMFKTLFGLDEEDEEKTFDQRIAEAGEMLVDNIPLGNLFTGGGRIPISEAFKGTGTLAKKLTNQKNQYGGDISWGDVGEDLLNSLPYWIAPTGYSQGKKTVQGLKTIVNGGEYKINSKGQKELKFPVENKNPETLLKALLFGKYALPTAQEYIKNDFKKLSAKQTKAYEQSGMTYKEYLESIKKK